MNGNVITQLPGNLDEMQKACVEGLTDALEEAMKGRISSIALVVCMDDGIAPVMAGKNAGGLNLGLDQIKEAIRAECFDKGNLAKPKPRSNILKVR